MAYWERLIHALVALDRLDPAAAGAVSVMLERTRRDEIWGLEVMVRAVHASVAGEPGDIARWAANVRAARHYLPQGRMAEMVLRATEVEVLLAGGLYDDARHVARNLPVNAVSLATHARLALVGGEYRQAATRAREALEHPTLSQRSVMECQLVLAGAHHALGERAAARAAFAEAARTAYASGQRRPLLVLRHSVFTALAAGDQRVLELWPEAYRPSERETVEEPHGGLTELLTPPGAGGAPGPAPAHRRRADRGGAGAVGQHRQVAPAQRLPQARCHQPLRRPAPRGRAGPGGPGGARRDGVR
nr:hypothetical protein DA06_08335 [Georgenia sp. SUBG003]